MIIYRRYDEWISTEDNICLALWSTGLIAVLSPRESPKIPYDQESDIITVSRHSSFEHDPQWFRPTGL